MKKLTKLALVSSMAISANAMAMQAMDDAALSASTGQDGINIGIGISKIEIEKLLIHDNDGLTLKGTPGSADYNGGTSTAGAIVIKGNGISGDVLETKGLIIGANYDNNGAYLLTSRNLADLRIDSDAGTGAKGAFINIAQMYQAWILKSVRLVWQRLMQCLVHQQLLFAAVLLILTIMRFYQAYHLKRVKCLQTSSWAQRLKVQ